MPLKKLETIQTYEIPEGVKTIGSMAFHGQRRMTSIIIPNTVEKISNSFTQRKYDGEIYYVSTTGLSNIQSELDIHTLNANAYRATNNNGVKPWGNLK